LVISQKRLNFGMKRNCKIQDKMGCNGLGNRCSRINIYIDIDGQLIRDAKPTARCFEFLRWAVKVHSPYWLRTRKKHLLLTTSARIR
jgi:hypothetical protein